MFNFSIENMLTVAFMAVTTLLLSAYIPQVWSSLRDKKTREGTVVSTWWIWTVGALIEALYMAVVIDNLLLVGIALVHLVACGIVAIAGTAEKFGHLFSKEDPVSETVDLDIS